MAAVVLIGSACSTTGRASPSSRTAPSSSASWRQRCCSLLATHAPLRFVGAWEMLAGVAFAAAGYLGTADRHPVPVVVTAGLHISRCLRCAARGHGAGLWTDAEDRSPRYVQARRRYSDAALPIGSGLLTLRRRNVCSSCSRRSIAGLARIGVAIAAGTRRDRGARAPDAAPVDRERVIGSERRLSDELTVAEAQYRSVVERVPGVVYVAEAGQHGRWHFVSPKIKDLLGLHRRRVDARPHALDQPDASRRSRPDDPGRGRRLRAALIRRAAGKYRLIARDGTRRCG